MKIFFARLYLSAALLLGLVPAHAQSLYVHNELFREGASASGTRTVAGLNNRGEVFYLYSPTNSPPGSSIPGLWLPKPNYGLPAGFSRLTNFLALARSALPWFTDDGTFYTVVTNVDQGNAVYRGSASGESMLCSQVTYDPLPTIRVPEIGGGDYYYGRRMFVVDGVTASGQPFGYVNVQRSINPPPWMGWMGGPSLFAGDMLLNGAFVGFPPQAPVTAIGTLCGPGGIPTTITSSPNGTMLVFNDMCCPDWQNAKSPYEQLAVAQVGSVRIISATPQHLGTEYPDPEYAFRTYPRRLTVNDAGDAAGVGAEVGSLWLSPHTGGVIRAGRTNVSSVLLDSAGTVWFVSNFYRDIWRGDQQDLSPADTNRLHLPWITWGYTGVPTLAFVNNRGQLLVHALKTNNQSYAVLLSPRFTVALTVSTNHLSVGDSLTVTATVTALGDQPLTGISPTGPLDWSGRGAFQLLSGPTPAPPWSLQPGGQMQAQWQCQATTNGIGRFGLTLQAPPLLSLPASSELVRIVPNGDLLIQRVIAPPDPPDSYAGGGIYQTVPNDPQIKTNTAPLNEDSKFQVQIQNKDKLPETFTLIAAESSPTNWLMTYLLGTQDVTAQLKSPAGATLPALSPGASLTLQVIMRPTNGVDGAVQRVDLTLGVASDATLSLDAVEAVTILANEIIVNSTGDLPDKNPEDCCCDTGRKLADGKTTECTLRAAIEFANRRAGKDIIKFEIPNDDPNIVQGVPSIRPQTALPDITGQVIIDGWSQSPSSARPPVELSGKLVRPRRSPGQGRMLFEGGDGPNADRLLPPDLASGLHLVAAGCEIRGLVINSFPLCGILVDGPETQIQGNLLGTDASGSGSAPSGELIAIYKYNERDKIPTYSYGGGGAQLVVRSPYNLIGGTDAKARNVISGGPNQIVPSGNTRIGYVGAPGLVLLGTAAIENIVQGNIIGLDQSASHPPTVPPGYAEADVQGTGQYAGVWIHNGSGNQVGGSLPGAGNVIAGNVAGVVVTGESATGNVVAGNRIGWSQNFKGSTAGGGMGVSLEGGRDNTVGGNAPGAGNVIGSALGIYMGGGSNKVQGNWFGVSPDGAVKLNGSMGVLETRSTSQIISNVFASLENVGLQMQYSDSSRVFGNKIVGCGKDGVRLVGGHGVLISHNSILGNGHASGMGAGIRLEEDVIGITISENSIDGSGDLGIISGPYGAKPTKGSYPALYYRPPPFLSNGQLKIGGQFTGLSGATYLLEFFANEHANPNGYGEGRTFIGSAAVTTSLTGHGVIDVTLPASHDPGNYVTATATAPDGSTSEFSNAALIQDCVPGTKGLCPGLEQQVPNLGSGQGARSLAPSSLVARPALPQVTSATGDGNGDGIQDYQQANVASLPSIVGVWVTLAAPSGTVLENVTPSGLPDFTQLPDGDTFPIGFLSFGITNLPTGGVLVVTNFLHLDAAPDFSYAATTFFNYGPTPDNPTAHWYQFNFDGTTGAELFADRIILHFRDGVRGDGDLVANGEIVTVGAPANQIPSGPPLQLLSATVNWVDTVDVQLDTNGAPVSVTNQSARANCVLAWPASATNWTLHFKDVLPSSDLIATNSLVAFLDFFWQPVPESPAVVNGQNVVTNTAISSSRFYRLVQSSWSAGLTAEELAEGTYSWTGAGAWSDPANWASTALIGGVPLSNRLQSLTSYSPRAAVRSRAWWIKKELAARAARRKLAR